MKRFLFTAAAFVLTLVTSSTASAQFPYNYNNIVNSANGAGNYIGIRNGGGFNPYLGVPHFGGTNVNNIVNSANGVGNTIDIRNGGRFGGFPVYDPYLGGGFNPGFGGGFVPGFGGQNFNNIQDSANGVGNMIRIRNR